MWLLELGQEIQKMSLEHLKCQVIKEVLKKEGNDHGDIFAVAQEKELPRAKAGTV